MHEATARALSILVEINMWPDQQVSSWLLYSDSIEGSYTYMSETVLTIIHIILVCVTMLIVTHTLNLGIVCQRNYMYSRQEVHVAKNKTVAYMQLS